MKQKKAFNKIESKILRVLYQQQLPLTIYEVAKESSISYPTAKKYLEKLSSRGFLLYLALEDKPEKYSFNYELLEQREKGEV